MMNKYQFVKARRIVRRRGWNGIRWMHIILGKRFSQPFFRYFIMNDMAVDVLQERQKIVEKCNEYGVHYDIRMLRSCDHSVIYR